MTKDIEITAYDNGTIAWDFSTSDFSEALAELTDEMNPPELTYTVAVTGVSQEEIDELVKYATLV